MGSSHVYLTDPFHEKGTNVKQFLVRWKGCASKDDTWESWGLGFLRGNEPKNNAYADALKHALFTAFNIQ